MVLSPLAARWYTVEHDPEWAEKVRREAPSARVFHVPAEVPNPRRPSVESEWMSYIQAPWRFRGNVFDLALIDGRARPECAVAILPFLASGGVVVVHDWHDRLRPHYRRILEKFELVESVAVVDRKRYGAGLAVFKPKGAA